MAIFSRIQKKLVFGTSMIILGGIGVAFIAWSAAKMAHVAADQKNVLVSRLERLRPQLSSAEADSIRAYLRKSNPTATLDQQNALVSRLQRVEHELQASEADSVRTFVDIALPFIERESLIAVLARDIGIAAIIAVILTVGVELYTRNRLQDEAREGIVEATFKRLIPAAVFEEIHHYVISARCVRRDWRVEMVVRKDPEVTARGADLFVSRTIVRYSMVNTSGMGCEEPISAGLDEDQVLRLPGRTLPRFVQVTIGDTVYAGADLARELANSEFRFGKSVTLGKEPVHVVLELEELLRVPDTFTWNTPGQTENAEIMIDTSNTPEIEVSVTALHPDRNRLHQDVLGRSWKFPGGILPWQGFQIATRARAASATTTSLPRDAGSMTV